jgi:hypothetical protein
MRYFRYAAILSLILLFGLLIYSSRAFCQQSQPPAKPAAAAPAPPKADAKADETIKQAIEQLDPRKLGWVDTKIWQESKLQGATLQTDGRYVSGPDYRLRTELTVKLGNMEGNLLAVCDGTYYWNRLRIGKEDKGVNKWEFKTIRTALQAPGTNAQFVEEFYKSQAFLGLLPLLESLRQQMIFIKQEPASLQGREMQKLTAVWSPEVSKAIVAPNSPWQLLVPQKCFIYLEKLEGKIAWPYRIEWRGPVTIRGDDSLLLQMEFRDPKILKVGSKEAQALMQLCTFDPRDAHVTDRTKEIAEQISQIQALQEKMKADKAPPTQSAPPEKAPPPK